MNLREIQKLKDITPEELIEDDLMEMSASELSEKAQHIAD